MTHHMTTLMIMIFFTLMAPLLSHKRDNFPSMAKNAMKLAFFISLCLLFINSSSHSWAANLNSSWLTFNASWIPLAIQFDSYSLMFMTVALFVSWSILEFSSWYMSNDPTINTFIKYLLIFLMAMIMLVSANNLLTLFIGWEGVGIMSYLLIGWYHARNYAAAAAIQAVLYNRIGDIGFLLAFCWAFKNLAFINLQSMAPLNSSPTLILVALIMAAASKSAQFGLHPWLAAAMEGPTPVSALLHSSTMVVAGIFLMIRISPMLTQNQTALTLCLCLGALSTFYASASALTQNDIKKIIAHSTSSQLGLMMVAIGIGQPHFAFFHICTHAFFKAMLFLCAGFFIHALNDEQDIRKMGGLHHSLPMISTCFSMGSLALMGTPFLSAFYSKDAIIESINTSYVNLTALLLTLMATMFTAIYSVRLIYFVSLLQTRISPTLLLKEHSCLPAIKPIIRLAYGSVIAGTLIFFIIIPDHPVNHTMPVNTKMSALILTIVAFIFAYDLAKLTWTIKPIKSINPKLINPLIYNQMTHRWWSQKLLNYAEQTINFLIENFMLKKVTTSLSHFQNPFMRQTQITQSGLIKSYLTTSLITLTIALIILYVLP